jgi:hypothetical protein
LAAIGAGDVAAWLVRDESDRDESALGSFVTVFVDVEGGSSGVPAGLTQLGLVQPYTLDGVDVGVAVIVKEDDAGHGISNPIPGK